MEVDFSLLLLSSSSAMINIPRRLRRRLALLTVAVVLLLAVWNVLLAPDSAIRLALHFNFSRLYKAVRNATVNRDGWLQRRAQYVVDLREDVGYLIKTGYGTRHRVPAQLAAFVEAGALLGEEGRSYLVVGDWTAVNETDAALLGADIHDAIKMVMDTKVDERHIDHHRFAKYRSLQEAVDAGDEDLANHIGQGFGWELDALKVANYVLCCCPF